MSTEAIKRTVRVTITKEIEVEFPPEFFSKYKLTQEQYLAEFNKSMWKVDGMDDVAMYAARMAATGGIGREEDALGLINHSDSTHPRKGDVLVREIDEDLETEII